jgi:hypothetical protein
MKNLCPIVAKEENVVHVPFKNQKEDPEVMSMTSFNHPPNAEGILAVLIATFNQKLLKIHMRT